MVGIVLDTVLPIRRGEDWQIKIAIFQSEKSFGYAIIKAQYYDDLPKGPGLHKPSNRFSVALDDFTIGRWSIDPCKDYAVVRF